MEPERKLFSSSLFDIDSNRLFIFSEDLFNLKSVKEKLLNIWRMTAKF